MAALILKNLSKLYKDGVVGVRNLNIEVAEGELMVLVGPSGSGKSTTLRLIAGLEAPTEGEIYVGGRRANDLHPRDRDIAMVFQDYALYPHLNVEQNLGFGLKMRGTPAAEVHSRVTEASRMLGIETLLRRKPKELSGGQRQRVALGRALVRNPKVFLFDEPLSNLDASLRVQLRREIKEIHQEVGATMVYVTHDQTEAMALGRRIAVMNDGTIEQVGSPPEIYRGPVSRMVAAFFGNPSMNLVECAAAVDSGNLRIKFAETDHSFLPGSGERFEDIGANVVVGFRPEDVSLEGSSPDDSLAGRARVTSVEAMGAETLVYMETGVFQPVARVQGNVELEAGSEIDFCVSREALHFFAAESGRKIRVE